MGRMISIAVAIVTPKIGIGFKIWCWCGYFYFLDKYFILSKVFEKILQEGFVFSKYFSPKPRGYLSYRRTDHLGQTLGARRL